MSRAVYQCMGRCKREFKAMAPVDARLGTGRPVMCCDEVARWVRPAEVVT